jgi:hypothetical protein
MGEVIERGPAMKPVLVQNLIQAAKKKRRKPGYSDNVIEADVSEPRPKTKDRSSSIIIAMLVIFVLVAVLTDSI